MTSELQKMLLREFVNFQVHPINSYFPMHSVYLFSVLIKKYLAAIG